MMRLGSDEDRLSIMNRIVRHVKGWKPGMYAYDDLDRLFSRGWLRGQELAESGNYGSALQFKETAFQLVNFIPERLADRKVGCVL